MATSEEYTPIALDAELSPRDLALESPRQPLESPRQLSAPPSSRASWSRHALALSIVSALVLGAIAVVSMRAPEHTSVQAPVVKRMEPIGMDVVNPCAPMTTAPPPVTTKVNPCVPMTTAPPPVTTNGNPCAVAPTPPAHVPQAASPAPSSKLCNSTIVQEVCGLVNGKTTEYWGTAADKDATILHAKEIADHLSTDNASVRKFLDLIKATNVEDAGLAGAFGVKCQELCEKTVAQVPAKLRPPKHDVGCFFTSRQSDTPLCDIDLSPEELTKIKVPGSRDPARASKFLHEVPNGTKPELSTKDKALDDLLSTPYDQMNPEQKDEWWKLAHHPKNINEMKSSILQMFRIYPPAKIAVTGKKMTAAEGRRLENRDSCSYANNGNCDEKWYSTIAWCYDGTDCTDCGTCNANPPAPAPSSLTCSGGGYYCQFPFRDGDDRYWSCAPGSNGNKPWCATTVRGEQTEAWAYCDCRNNGCCPGGNPPSPPRWEPPPPAPSNQQDGTQQDVPNWKQDVIRNGMKAQGFIQTTLNKMGAWSIGSKVLEYYGQNDWRTRAEIKRNLNGIKDMLNNVDYVHQGESGGSCGGTTIAYVMNSGKTSQRTCGYDCNDGAFIINICGYYFTMGEVTKIGTIIHEGAHHMTMRLNDVKWGYKTAYGNKVCREMANSCKAGYTSACTKCLRNADNLEYLAEDANGGT